jgi:1-acyl-sn-glycerol-3-phosphate acyltransferase
MSLVYSVVTSSLKSVTRILCKVDDAQLINVPKQGPLILACNHVNFIEVPLLFTHLQPRPVTGFAKAETWDNPAMGFLFDLWGAIPLQRGEADTTAFRRALDALEAGKILAIAPEGTRSGHGRLQSGNPGIVMLALRSNAPILPVVYFGGERIHNNLNRLKRTDFHIRVGKLFWLHKPDGQIDREIRKIMVDEIMYQLAVLLPEEYRGYYSDFSKVTTNYIHFA